MSLILSGTDGLSDVDGSASTPAIRGTDANTGIFFPAADTIAFAEGGAEVARFDSSGRLTVPNQPMFFASRTSSYSVSAGANTIQLDTTSLNIGNCFNTSNYRFTAPVAGRYFISASLSVTGINASQNYIGLLVYLNGTTYVSGFDCTNQTGSVYKLITVNFLVSLSANDYLTLVSDFQQSSVTINHDDKRTHLMGYLVS